MFDGQNWNLVSIKKHYILKLKTFISRELLDVDHLNFYQLKEKKECVYFRFTGYNRGKFA